MKIFEVYNEDALDLLADIIDPATTILADKEVEKLYKSGNRMGLIKYLLKNHNKEIVAVLAVLECKPVKEYKANIIAMTKQLLEILNDKDLMAVFSLQGQSILENYSGSATENIEEIVAK